MEKENTNQELEHKELVEEAQSSVNADEQIRSDNADTPHDQPLPDVPEAPGEGEPEKQDDERPDRSDQLGELEDIDPLASFEQDQQRSGQDNEERLTIPDVLPVLPLKDTVVYPFSVQPLGVGQERSIRLIDDVMRGDRLVVLVAQKSAAMEQAGPDDIFKIGTVARVGRMFRMPDGTLQI
ncbi:MAG: LON peptidase substrate-binding domain-containing protein, partial [Ktedonobacteraceae bacterium]|nr:LON peptidase substrate-binding domain-containing protein [Ktedonobacteraceae bacterium]